MRNVRRISKKYHLRQIVACFLVYCLFFGMPMVAQAVENPLPGALPSYGTPGVDYQVGAGSIGTIDKVGSDMTLNSVANGTVIYINNHDIGSLASVMYNQVPDGWALVKINDTLDSTFYGDGAVTGIAGILTATGNFIMSNSRGIVSAPGSYIHGRNLVLSAMRINDTDFGQFANGDIDELKFDTQVEDIGSVTNNGGISGIESVYIAAKNITNAGTISSPGGCVVMAAGNSARIGRPGSDVTVEVSQGTTYPDDRVIDNGGSWGNGIGTIEATGGKVILAAGDIYSTAIEGVESLRAEATGDITLNGAIGASGHVEILGGQNRIISRHAQININDDITAGSMRIKNGKDVEPGEESLSGIYVAEDKNLTATAGDVVVEAVHDVILGGDVSAAGDVFINGDEDGWGDPKGENYNPRAYGGGDVIANNIEAGGNIDIKGNAIQLKGDVSANGGDLTITGRTSKDNYTDFSESGLDVEWGYIDVAEYTTLYAGDDVILKDAYGSGGDEEPPAGEMDLIGHGGLAIVAEGGSIQTQGPFGEGVKITVEDLSPSELIMVQADPLNLADYSFGNQNNTELYLESYNGSVTAVDSSHPLSGKNENAADQWASITVDAYTDITLQGHDASRDITAGPLTSNATGFDTGNITVTSDNSKVLLTGNVSANQGSIAVTAIDGGIVSSGDIEASDGITLFGEVTADGEGDQTFDAGNGTLWAKDTLSTITKTGPGGLTLGGDTLVDLDGIEDSVWVQAGPLTIEDSVDVEGNLKAQGIIHLQGTTNNVAGDILSTGSGIIFDHDVDADGVGDQLFDAGTGQLVAENGADIDKSTAGSLTLAGDTGIELGGNVTGTGMTSVDKLTFKNNVTADGTGEAQDQRFDAGLGALDADYSIAKTEAGKLNLGGDEGIELGGNVETQDGDLTFEDAVTANGTGNQVFDADGTGTDLIAYDDIIKNTDGKLTLGAGTQPDAQIELAGDVKTSNGDLIFWDKVVANGTGNQVFDADGTGTDLIADDDIIKTTAGSLTLGAGTQPDAQIELAGDVTTADGDLTLWDQVIANGSDSQRLDAVGGKLWATDAITKTTTGNLNLGGDDAIDLDGTVDVDAGSLTIEDDFTAAADLIASENVTLGGAATLDGSVNQKIEATNGSLYANDSVHKTGTGNLDMFGGYNGPLYPDMDYSVKTKAVTVDEGELSIAGNATVRLDGSIYSKGNMTLASNVDGIASTPSSPGTGSPEVPYDYLVHYNGTIQSLNGNVDISAQNSFIALDGGNNMPDAYVSAGGDILLRDSTWIQYSNKLDAGHNVEAFSTVHGNGSLTVLADNDILLRANVSSVGEMTMDAGSDIELNRNSGNTSSDSTISLNAGDSITIGKAFGDNGNVTANGSMGIFAGTDSEDNVKVFGKLTTTNGGNIDVTAGGDIKLYGSFVDSAYESAQADGDLTLDAEDDLVVLGDLISNNGSIELSSDNTTTYLGGDVTAAIDVTLNNNTEFFGCGDQKVDAQTGMITARGRLLKDSYSGSLYLEAAGDISLAGDVVVYPGGVSIISENGKIFTPGGNNDTLNIYIQGYSDQLEGDGVSLPGDPEKKAAIVIISQEDLKLGPDSQLIANGYYLPLHAIDLDGIDSFEGLDNYWDELYGEFGDVIDYLRYSFEAYLNGLYVEPEDFTAYKELLGDYLAGLDDRPAIGFLAEPGTAIGGIIRDEGDPIDVAVYLQSETGDVDVESQLISVYYNGTMVVDAYDTVRFGDLTSEPVIQTVESVDVREGRLWEIDRLEVVSRLTEWLFEADAFGTLPYPYNPEIVEAFIGGEYVLRGAGLGNPDILDGRAWVLEDPLNPAPLYEEAGEAAEEEEFAEGGCPALMDWLAIEIGVPAEDIQVSLAGALALNTDVQPCEMCARLKDAATTMEDADGMRIAAMARVVNEFVTTPAPPSPEQMTQIAAALSEHVGDGTYYALAGDWIDALVAYVGIMNTEMGYSASDSAAFVKKYLTPVTETGNAALIAYVQARLAALGG